MDEDGSSFINTTTFDNETLTNITTFNNETLTCAARNLNEEITYSFTNSKSVIMILRSIQIIYNLLLILFGLPLNSMVICLIWKFKKLQNLSFIIALQVMVVNLVNLTFRIVPVLITTTTEKWLFGEHMCAILGCISLITIISRTMLMLVLVIDRFLTVSMPFSLPKHHHKIMWSVIVISWTISVLYSVAFVPGLLDCYTFVPSRWRCLVSPSCSYPCVIAINIAQYVIIVPCCVVPLLLYIVLFLKARRFQNVIPSVSNLTDNGDAPKREWRATITFFLMFITFFAVTIPSTTVYVLSSTLFTVSDKPLWFIIVEVAVTYLFLLDLLVILDPIFIMRNRDVREMVLTLNWTPEWCKQTHS